MTTQHLGAVKLTVGDSKQNLRPVYHQAARRDHDERIGMVDYRREEIIAYSRGARNVCAVMRTLPGRWEGWLPGLPSDSPLRLLMLTTTPAKAFVPLETTLWDLPRLWHESHVAVAQSVELAAAYAQTVPVGVVVDRTLFDATYESPAAVAQWLAGARYALDLSERLLAERLAA